MVMYGDCLRCTLISWESCNKPLDIADLRQGLDYTMCLRRAWNGPPGLEVLYIHRVETPVVGSHHTDHIKWRCQPTDEAGAGQRAVWHCHRAAFSAHVGYKALVYLAWAPWAALSDCTTCLSALGMGRTSALSS